MNLTETSTQNRYHTFLEASMATCKYVRDFPQSQFPMLCPIKYSELFDKPQEQIDCQYKLIRLSHAELCAVTDSEPNSHHSHT